MSFTEKDTARFWSNVIPEPMSGCWLWTGYRNDAGYGLFGVGRQHYRAHRVAWELTNGPIPDGLFGLHKCDNPACVNPLHVFIGTSTDNMQDMARKGRNKYPLLSGSRSSTAKLSDAQVREIREKYFSGGGVLGNNCYQGGVKQQDLAEEYGVTQGTIGSILRKVTWKHIT